MNDFTVPPLSRAARIVFGLMLLSPWLLLVGIAMLGTLEPADRLEQGIAAGAAFALMGGIALIAGRRRVSLEGKDLVVRAALYTQRIPLDGVDWSAARVVSLEEHLELRPMLRMNGMSVPRFHCGHYRTREGTKAFVMITDRTRVLVLPERSGRLVMLSLERPKVALEAMKGKVGA